jgi:hypothetical protein
VKKGTFFSFILYGWCNTSFISLCIITSSSLKILEFSSFLCYFHNYMLVLKGFVQFPSSLDVWKSMTSFDLRAYLFLYSEVSSFTSSSIFYPMLIFIYFIYFLLLCWVGLHCRIYKSSYNISNISCLNSPPPPFSFIHSCLASWNSFNRPHFSTYILMYTVFTLYSPSCTQDL